MGGYSSYGIQRTLNRASRFVQRGFPVYLRTYSNLETQDAEFAQLGFQVSASGGEANIDILIEPPPMVTDISLHDIGLNAAILSFGSKRFQISQAWVVKQQIANNYIQPGTGLPDYYQVFRAPSVQGIYYEQRMFKIVSILPDVVQAIPMWWTILGAYQEQPVIP